MSKVLLYIFYILYKKGISTKTYTSNRNGSSYLHDIEAWLST
jgi:hypothetical protein